MVPDEALDGKTVFTVVFVVKFVGLLLRELKVSLKVLVCECG